MDYNTFAAVILRFAIQSSLCFALAWILDRYGAQNPKIRLWTWNLAALLAVVGTLLPHLPSSVLQCPLSGHSALYLNYIFQYPSATNSVQAVCAATIITWLWGIGTLARLGAWCRNILRVRRQLALRRPCLDKRILQEVRRSAHTLGFVHPIRVSVHPSFGSPVVVSRSELCLSPSVFTLDVKELRAVIGHELAHIQRIDHLKIPLLELARCFSCFAPLWKLFHSARTIQVEKICDLRGCQSSGSAHAMASALINIASFQRKPQGFLASLGPKRSQLVRRVRALMHPRGQSRIRTFIQATTLVLALLVVAGFQSYAPLITMHSSRAFPCPDTDTIDL